MNMKNAITKGDIFTKLSLVIMGLGCIARKQVIKGILFLLIEVSYIVFMIDAGAGYLKMLPSLGWRKQEEVWNEALGVYEYTQGDNSQLILLYGVVTIFITIAFIITWRKSVISAYTAQVNKNNNQHNTTFIEDVKSLFDSNLHKLLLTLPVLGILIFNILPLVYMICMAFTNYSKIDQHLVLFDWVGLQNFAKIFNSGDMIGRSFWKVFVWTIIWAVFATGLNYILGMMLALLINREGTKGKGFWRFWFVLSVAIPQFVSLLAVRSMLKPNGVINEVLLNAGLIDKALPFLTDPTWARVTVIIVNLWIGIPFTMLQTTGILQNIPTELYEAAKVDGANAITRFFKITLPYMLFVTAPYLITTFMNNINNFNVIYLLTAGEPIKVGESAGQTDLLVTWLYKLTVDYQYFNLGAVIGIMTFIILAITTLLVYRRTGSYNNEEGFQ